MKLKSKAIEVDAIKWDGSNTDDIKNFIAGTGSFITGSIIYTPKKQGTNITKVGDYLIKEENHIYPCPSYLFEKLFK